MYNIFILLFVSFMSCIHMCIIYIWRKRKYILLYYYDTLLLIYIVLSFSP